MRAMESGEERVDWKRNEVKRGFGLLGGLNLGSCDHSFETRPGHRPGQVIGSRVRWVDPGQPKKKTLIKKAHKKNPRGKGSTHNKTKTSCSLVFIFPPNIEENEPA
jgi:hypothetical protein